MTTKTIINKSKSFQFTVAFNKNSTSHSFSLENSFPKIYRYFCVNYYSASIVNINFHEINLYLPSVKTQKKMIKETNFVNSTVIREVSSFLIDLHLKKYKGLSKNAIFVTALFAKISMQMRFLRGMSAELNT